MKETKRERFIRVAEQRTQKVLDDLKALSKCAHPAVYELTEEDVEKIFAAIDQAVNDARDTLSGRKRFTLSDTSTLKGADPEYEKISSNSGDGESN